jgi:hypothetical protein
VALFDRLSLGFGFKIVDLDFIPFDILREEALISCCVGAKKKSAAVAVHGSSMCICQHSWHTAITDLRITKLFINVITLSLPMEGVERNSYATLATCHLVNPADVRHHSSTRATTLGSVLSSAPHVAASSIHLVHRTALMSTVASQCTSSKLSPYKLAYYHQQP